MWVLGSVTAAYTLDVEERLLALKHCGRMNELESGSRALPAYSYHV